MAQKKCKICAENSLVNYFSVNDNFLGKNLSTVITNLCGFEILGTKLSVSKLSICQICVISIVQAETIAEKLKRAFSSSRNLKRKESCKTITSTPKVGFDKFKENQHSVIVANNAKQQLALDPETNKKVKPKKFGNEDGPQEPENPKKKRRSMNNESITKDTTVTAFSITNGNKETMQESENEKSVHLQSASILIGDKETNFEIEEKMSSGETNKKTKHKINLNPVTDTECDRFQCKYCEFKSKFAKGLKIHLVAIHQVAKPSLFKCSQCSKAYRQSKRLDRHINAAHSNKNLPHRLSVTEPDININGSHLMKSNKCNESLSANITNNHYNEDAKECPNCAMIFRSKQKFEEHVFSEKCQNAIIPCQAPNCNKRFSRQQGMMLHMQKQHPHSFKSFKESLLE